MNSQQCSAANAPDHQFDFTAYAITVVLLTVYLTSTMAGICIAYGGWEATKVWLVQVPWWEWAGCAFLVLSLSAFVVFYRNPFTE